MRKLLLLSLLVYGATLVGQELKINSESAKISFNFVDEKTKGTIKGLKATISFNADDPSKASILGSVDAKTLTTGNKTRDKHLQSADFFETAKYPTISFKSTSIEKNGTQYKMKGKMKMKGIEKDVIFIFTYADKTFKGTASVYAQDWGVWKKGKREKSKVDITIEIPVL